jgi:hypothetical protein
MQHAIGASGGNRKLRNINRRLVCGLAAYPFWTAPLILGALQHGVIPQERDIIRAGPVPIGASQRPTRSRNRDGNPAPPALLFQRADLSCLVSSHVPHSRPAAARSVRTASSGLPGYSSGVPARLRVRCSSIPRACKHPRSTSTSDRSP